MLIYNILLYNSYALAILKFTYSNFGERGTKFFQLEFTLLIRDEFFCLFFGNILNPFG